MFGIGMPEMILILAIALIVIGPKKLPDLAKSLGRAMREFKKATNELKETMEIDTELGDVKQAFDDMNKDLTSMATLGELDKEPSESADSLPGDETEQAQSGSETEQAQSDSKDAAPVAQTEEERSTHEETQSPSPDNSSDIEKS